MDSIKNCSFVYSKLVDLINSLAFLKRKQIVEVLSLSSVGPGIFAITQNPDYCLEAFEKAGLKTIVTSIENGRYKARREKLGT